MQHLLRIDLINPRLLFRVFFWLSAAMMGEARLAKAETMVVGVDIPGVGQMSADQQAQLLNELHGAGVEVVRAWVSTEMSYAFIKKADALGIKTELTLSVVSLPDAPKRAVVAAMPWMYGAVPLSAANVGLTKATFQTQLDTLEGMGIQLVAFELGNELNSPAFNGEFKLYAHADCTTCRTFGLNDLKDNPDAQSIAAGFRNYVKLLAAVKDVRDHSRLNSHTPILLGGLADEGSEIPIPNARASRVSVKGAIQYMRQFGLDAVVDGYGIHTYPWDGPPKPGAAAARRKELEGNSLSECRPAGSASGKPCWITEWGFKNETRSCPTNDEYRASLVREFMSDDLKPYVREERIVGMLYFEWRGNSGSKSDDPYSIYRCGRLTDSGRLVIDSKLLR